MFTLLNRVIKTAIIADTTETSGEAIINASVDRSLLRLSTQTGAPQLDFGFPPSFRTIPADKSVKVHNGPRLKPRLKLFFFFRFVLDLNKTSKGEQSVSLGWGWLTYD